MAARPDPRLNKRYRNVLPSYSEPDSSSHSERDASPAVSNRSSSSSVASLSTPTNKRSKVSTPGAPRRSKVASRRSPRLASQKGRVLNFDSSDEEDTSEQRRGRSPASARSPSKPRSKSRPRSKTPAHKRKVTGAHKVTDRDAPAVASRPGRAPSSSTSANRHRSRSHSKGNTSSPKSKAGRKISKPTDGGRKVGRSIFY